MYLFLTEDALLNFCEVVITKIEEGEACLFNIIGSILVEFAKTNYVVIMGANYTALQFVTE